MAEAIQQTDHNTNARSMITSHISLVDDVNPLHHSLGSRAVQYLRYTQSTDLTTYFIENHV